MREVFPCPLPNDRTSRIPQIENCLPAGIGLLLGLLLDGRRRALRLLKTRFRLANFPFLRAFPRRPAFAVRRTEDSRRSARILITENLRLLLCLLPVHLSKLLRQRRQLLLRQRLRLLEILRRDVQLDL